MISESQLAELGRLQALCDEQRDQIADLQKAAVTSFTLVSDSGELIGLEFERGGQSYFIAGRQDVWSGIRLGKFPRDSIGGDYRKVKVA